MLNQKLIILQIFYYEISCKYTNLFNHYSKFNYTNVALKAISKTFFLPNKITASVSISKCLLIGREIIMELFSFIMLIAFNASQMPSQYNHPSLTLLIMPISSFFKPLTSSISFIILPTSDFNASFSFSI